MNIHPAIDLREGRCVRLLEGDFNQETRYQADPVTLIQSYEQAGAPLVHVVDLDGAKEGEFTNLPVIESMARSVSIPLQCGGGIRKEADLRRLYSAGISRAVIGSLAISEPDRVRDWLTRFGPDRMTLALDCRWSGEDYLLATAGWTRAHEMSVEQCLERYAGSGLLNVLCTDIARDGMLKGPNVDLYDQLSTGFPQLAIQASGGVGKLGDLPELAATNVAAVIVGKALLEGRFSLAEAQSCLRGE